jgi:hypothetical protein
MSEIAQIHTSCKDCVFAVYKKNTQTDCALDYMNKYKSKNVQVLEAYDEYKEFYILNNKKCIGYRENKWLKNNDLPTTVDLGTKIELYNKTNKIDYICVIDTKNLTFDQLQDIVEQIHKDIPPMMLYIIRYNDNNNFKYENLKGILDNLKYPWKINTCLDETSFGYFLDNITTFNKKSRFVLGITEYSAKIVDIINKANDIVHNQLDHFVVLGNKSKTVMMFSAYVYKYGKYIGKNIFDNIEHYDEI